MFIESQIRTHVDVYRYVTLKTVSMITSTDIDTMLTFHLVPLSSLNSNSPQFRRTYMFMGITTTHIETLHSML